MTQEGYIEHFLNPKVIAPLKGYNFKADQRLLIPFQSGSKVGFLDSEGHIKVPPKYLMCYGDCYTEDDYIFVSCPFILPKSNGVSSDHTYISYGLIDYTGTEILPVEYRKLIPAIGNKELYSAQNKELKYGVIDICKKALIVPFGKYEWIDGFCNGLARIKIGTSADGTLLTTAKWGLIKEDGTLVAVCDYIYPFYNHTFNNRLAAKNNGFDIFIKVNTLGEGLFGCAKVIRKNSMGKCLYQQCFVNLKGEEVISLKYLEEKWIITEGFKNGYAKIECGVKKALINKHGNVVKEWTEFPEILDNTDYYDLINDGLDGEADAIWNII